MWYPYFQDLIYFSNSYFFHIKLHLLSFDFSDAEFVASPGTYKVFHFECCIQASLWLRKRTGLIRTPSHSGYFACRKHPAQAESSLFCQPTHTHSSMSLCARVYWCVFRCKFKRAARIEFSDRTYTYVSIYVIIINEF